MGWSEKGPQAERQKDGEVEQEEIAFYFGATTKASGSNPKESRSTKGATSKAKGARKSSE